MLHPFPNDLKETVRRMKQVISLNPLFLDTETTGLGESDEICEIAVIDIEGRVLINELVKPTIAIPESATSLHGITNDMVIHAPTLKDLYINLDMALRDRFVVTYNVGFDETMLWNSMGAHSMDRNDVWWKLSAGAFQDESGQAAHWLSSRWVDLMDAYACFYGVLDVYYGSYRWQRLAQAALQCDIKLPHEIHRAHADAELTRRIALHVASAVFSEQEGGSNE